MKKQNSRKIMLEAISHVAIAAVAVAVFLGGAFIVRYWDKIMPIDNPYESTQNFAVLPNHDGEPEGDLPISNTSDPKDTAENKVTEKGEEIEPAEETGQPPQTYNESKGELIVKIASDQIGIPFKMGGDSPEEGFDSSGFTYYCVNQAGIEFPRSIKDQLNSGAWVSYDELSAGDVVYFSHEAGGEAKFCGIYIGNGQIIYSPVPDESVKTANITTNYWTTHFVTGLRVNPQTGE